ncbi:hypothetical protein MMC10_002437 [Thelotrema lepadinum]|nr:hypothetical protein [Thelotrema lepadinum]
MASDADPISLAEDSQPSPRSTSLAAAARVNAGNQAQEGRHVSGSFARSDNRGSSSPALRRTGTNGEGRRSNVVMNINLNDPALPAPGELQTIGDNRPPSHSFKASSPQTGISRSPSMADPHHHNRAPSLGELHQELEQEQEAQVVRLTPRTLNDFPQSIKILTQFEFQNRLLQTIRQQQTQIHILQTQVGTPAATATGTEASPSSERSFSFTSNARTRSPAPPLNRSRRPSQASPAPSRGLPSGIHQSHMYSAADESAIVSSGTATPIGGGIDGGPNTNAGAGRDQTAYYQAETQTLTRENQMLKARIKELERQLSHSHTDGPSQRSRTSSNAAAPASSSNLVTHPHPGHDEGKRADGRRGYN